MKGWTLLKVDAEDIPERRVGLRVCGAERAERGEVEGGTLSHAVAQRVVDIWMPVKINTQINKQMNKQIIYIYIYMYMYIDMCIYMCVYHSDAS